MEKKTHKCTFAECNSAFDRPYKLMRHLLVHENAKPFVCTEAKDCSKSYSNKCHLQRHINSSHKNIACGATYKCPECFKEYSNRQNLKRHLKSHEKLLSCDICKLVFAKKNVLKAHIYTHTGVMPFSCKICTKEFKTFLDRKKHMKSHKTYTCNVCNANFQHWSLYQKHRKASHNSAEFICNDCGRKFNKRSYIVRHVKTHFGYVLQCPYVGCKRTYTNRSNLNQHYLIKHEQKKHDCGICNAKLSTKAKLKNHIANLHDSNGNPKTPKALKTLLTGRKERSDKGSMKVSTAIKLAGLSRIVESQC